MQAFCKDVAESDAKLLALCERRRRVSPDPESYVYSGKKLPGITRALRERFEPGPVRKRRGGSSKEIGTRVHRAVRHALDCVRSGACDCPKGSRPGRRDRRAKAILAELAKQKLRCLGCEVPVCAPRRATRLDLVCRKADTGRLWVVSLKTGRLDDRGSRAMAAPLDFVKRTAWGSACVQAACELGLLRTREGVSRANYCVIWADDDGAHFKRADSWVFDSKIQDAILTNIGC